MTEDDDAVLAVDLFFGSEGTSECGGDAHDLKEFVADLGGVEALRWHSVLCERGLPVGEIGKRGEDMAALADIFHVRERNLGAVTVAALIAPEQGKAVGFGVGH